MRQLLATGPTPETFKHMILTYHLTIVEVAKYEFSNANIINFLSLHFKHINNGQLGL